MKVKIYVEGGDVSSTLGKCRKGFSKFFENATFKRCMPTIVACGGRKQAYDDFCTALKTSKPDEFPVLLVDSEEVVLEKTTKWAHLKKRKGDGWSQPPGATEKHVYLMSVCMESWFLADKTELKKYYGQGFNDKALPQNPSIEDVDKQKLYGGLKKATAKTQKGEYSKGGHSL